MSRPSAPSLRTAAALASAFAFSALAALAAPAPINIVNVSYDPTRELYQEYNAAFAKHWKAESGQDVTFKLSHGGSGKQARAVIDGLDADVVTLALSYDIDNISEKAQLLPRDWQKSLPHNSSPYYSTIVLVVRKGNPKHIKDWDDLARPGIAVAAASPKTGGGARWNYLAAWGYALRKFGGDQEKARQFVAKIYLNAPVLDAGARGATNTFLQRKIGDVLIAWENEAFLAVNTLAKDEAEIIVPSVSILAEPPVAVVERVASRHGTLKAAQAYLQYLYSEEGQDIIGRNYYRPRSEAAIAKYGDRFPKLELFTIEETFGGWKKAQKTHFDDGGTFDRIFRERS
jgi:sulfate/thiosulfate-binding protein